MNQILGDDGVEHLRRLGAAASCNALTEQGLALRHRPWIEHDPAGTLQRMHDEREALHSDVADQTVDVDGLTPNAVADRIDT